MEAVAKQIRNPLNSLDEEEQYLEGRIGRHAGKAQKVAGQRLPIGQFKETGRKAVTNPKTQ